MIEISFLFTFLVAEQAESIDNPLHEAAKRGGTVVYRSLMGLSTDLIAHCQH